MDNKTIAITGANRGVGLACCKYFLSLGWSVWGISRSTQNLDVLKSENEKNLYVTKFDLESVENIATDLKNKNPFTNIKVLINNAGLLVKKPINKMELNDIERSMRVNFLAPYMIIKSLLPNMSNSSQIVNISTMGAVQGSVKFPELTAYGSSKAALCNLTEVLAAEFSETSGPKINCLALGAVQTDMLEEAFPGYDSGTSPEEMAAFIGNFILHQAPLYHGKILPVSNSTP